MKKAVLMLLLFVAHNYLITRGLQLFGMFALPFLILIVSAVLVAWYFKTILSAGQYIPDKTSLPRKKIIGFIIGVCSIAILWQPAMNMLAIAPDPATGSDVVPQLVALYQRFTRGIQPYYPLEQYSWHPFPVYMPLHWLPLGIGYLLHIDIRWVGFIFMALSSGVLGYFVWSRTNGIKKIVAMTIPAIALYCFTLWAGFEISISYELIVAAYYLLLCTGLVSGNLAITTAGIIACILSRYTAVFWLPLFAIVLWQNIPVKKSIFVWSSVLLAGVLLYVIPFYLRDPSILSKGVAYHNMCYVDIWEKIDDPKNTVAFNGLNFSYYIYITFSGDAAHRILVTRVIQAILMLALVAAGVILYRKWRYKVNYNHFALGMLYCFIQVFYLFNPINYLYYYFPVQIVAAALCVQIILTSPASSKPE